MAMKRISATLLGALGGVGAWAVDLCTYAGGLTLLLVQTLRTLFAYPLRVLVLTAAVVVVITLLRTVAWIRPQRAALLIAAVLVLGALALTTLLLAAFVPITVFFLVTGANYHFLQLLHVAILLISGGFGMYTLQRGLELVCERRGEYPKNAIKIMRAWALIFAFVGIQMAWNLRPFLGDRDGEFQVFRDYEGNFYAAVIYSAKQLFEGDPETNADEPTASTIPLDRLLTDPADSTVADSGSRPR